MKRVLSLVLVLVLALGSIPFAFAADTMTAGETLKGYGLAKGVDAEGNLNEEGMLTRAEMMVMISRLLGVEEEAMTYAIPSTSKDAQGHWAAKYIAYAEQVGKWSNGVGDNMFAPDAKVTNQMVAKFMMTALGYDVVWETAVADATALGLMAGVEGEATANITRGDVFKAALNTINQPKKGTTVKLGVALGVMTEETPVVVKLDGAVIDSVKAVAANLVEVNFEDAVAAEAAGNMMNYGITEKATTSNVIVINGVSVEDEDTVLIETAALKNGLGYTLTIDGKNTNFSGIAKDSDVPEVKSVLGTDTGIVEVTFDKALIDKATAEDIANYSIDKEGTVVKAVLKEDRKTVKLYVEGFTTTSAKNLTVENVLSIDKVAMKKTTKVFFTKFDKFAPTVTLGTQKANNVNVVLNVVDEHGVDKEVASNVANYVIDGLTVVSAKASKSVSTLDYYDVITLRTSEQTNGKLYSLKVSNLMDGSNAKNVMTKEANISFRGLAADKTKPAVTNVIAKTTTEIHVIFSESNDLDATTALNPANYELDKTDFTILEAKFEDDETDSKTIVLTTSTQPDKAANFKMTVSNVADEFNNTMTKVSRYFTSTVEDTTKPVISKGLAITDTKVQLTFASAVKKSVATDPTNYVANKEIGSPTKAELDTTGKIVTLTFSGLEANVAYELTVKNIVNLYNVSMDEKIVKFIGLAVGVDKEAPTVDSFYLTNVNELRVIFSEKVQQPTGMILTATNAGVTINFTAKALLADEKTVVFEGTTAVGGNPLSHSTTKSKDFTIQTFTGVKDLAGNNFKYDVDNKLTLSQVGEGTVTYPKLLSWAQEDVKTFIFYFDKEVADPATTMVVNGVTLTLERDEDDFTVVRGEASTNISTTFKGTTAFIGKVKDLIGLNYEDSVASKEVEISGGLVDTTSPTIVAVRTLDIKHIEVEYDETVAYAGTYYYKESTATTWTSLTNTSFDKKVVTITLPTNMDDEKVYEFKQNENVLAKDGSNNKAVNVGTTSFVGVENAAATAYFYGVEFVNGNTIKLKSSMKFVDADPITFSYNGVNLLATSVKASAGTVNASRQVSGPVSTVELHTENWKPFLKHDTNKYLISIGTASIEFSGIVEQLTKATTGSSSKSTVNGVSNVVVKIAVDNYAHSSNYSVTVSGPTVSGVATITEAGVVQFDVASANKTDVVSTKSAEILIKNGDSVIYYTKAAMEDITTN